DAIAILAKYILRDAQRVYASRQGAYGSRARDFSPFAELLVRIPQSYKGVAYWIRVATCVVRPRTMAACLACLANHPSASRVPQRYRRRSEKRERGNSAVD